MSDIQLKSEINSLIDKSGYTKSKYMICPLCKIITMRHTDVSFKQAYNITKSLL